MICFQIFIIEEIIYGFILAVNLYVIISGIIRWLWDCLCLLSFFSESTKLLIDLVVIFLACTPTGFFIFRVG